MYSRKNQMILRLFAVAAILILSAANILSFFSHSIFYPLLITNLISISLLIVFLFFPSRIEFYSIISGIYSAFYFLFEPENAMCVFQFFIFIAILYIRGYFNHNRKFKNILTGIVFLLLWLSQLRFGLKIFFNSSIQIVSTTVTCFCVIFFINYYFKDFYSTQNKNKILDLSKYDSLKKRDAEWLVQIKNKTKYETIAINYGMTEGAVKNRIRFIYQVLNVGDKTGFLNKYSEFKISFAGDFIEED